MPEVGSLNVDLILGSAEFQAGLAKANAAMSAFEKSMKPIAKNFTKFGKQLETAGKSLTTNLTLPIIAATAAIGAAVVHMTKYGSEINDMSVRTGFSRESLQELKFAADQTGVSMESIEGSTRKLTKSMGEAASGGGKTAQLFNKLGISIKNADGSLRPANQVFGETLDALRRIPDETTRNAIGMQLLGKSAGDLNPLIAEGKDGLNRFAQEARDAGLIMSEEAVIAADNFGDQMDKLKAQFGHAGMEIGQAFLPLIQQFMGFLSNSVIPAVKSFAHWLGNLTDTQKKWIVGIAVALAALGPLLSMTGKISKAIGFLLPLLAGLSAPVLAIAATVVAAVAIIIYNWDSIVAYFSSGDGAKMWANIKEAASKFWETLKGLFNAGVDLIMRIWDRFGGTIMNEFSKAFDFLLAIAGNTFAALADYFSIFSSLIKGDWGGVWDGIVSVAVNSFQLILRVVTRGIDIFLAIVEGGLGLFSDSMAANVAKARKSVDGFKNGIVEFTNQYKRVPVEADKATSAISAFSKATETTKVKTDELNVSLGENNNKYKELKPQIDVAAGAWETITPLVAATTTAVDANAVSFMNWSVGTTETTLTSAEQIKAAWVSIGVTVVEVGKQMATEAFTSIGETIGLLAAGHADASEAFKQLFIGVFDNLKKIGASLIATGIPLAIATPTMPEGLKMIAAGTGVVAAATVASSTVSAFAEGGLVFGETMGIVGEGRGTTPSNPEVIAPLDKLMNFMPQGQGGGQYEFIISGENLKAILDRTNKSRRFLGNG